MASVGLRQVRKVYPDGFAAVHDATFEVADGELLVLVGPSGCGKSTLLRMIAGLESISAGELSIGGRVVNDVAPKDRDIAMVFQSYALYPHMSVAENLAFALKLRGHDRAAIAERVQEAATMLGLDALLERKPAALSGGQRQRVALGRALVRHPQVFLLDEPLSNLDAKLRAGMRTEIARLHRSLNATMVYVTHDQIEAMTLGQRIVVLNAGRIQQIDTPMNLYRRPANLFVATFLGSPAMNILRGRIGAGDGGALLQLEDGQTVPLGLAQRPAQATGELAVGVRPEHLLIADPADAHAFQAIVEVVEQVGNEVLCTLRLGDQELIARLPPELVPEPGQPFHLKIAPAHLHLFDAGDGHRLAD